MGCAVVLFAWATDLAGMLALAYAAGVGSGAVWLLIAATVAWIGIPEHWRSTGGGPWWQRVPRGGPSACPRLLSPVAHAGRRA